MKAVLISIQPKWCELIASGKKTLEVRKTRPKLETPFKCYIYCTLTGSNEFFRDDLNGDVAAWNRGKWGERKGNVIGEFICDAITPLFNVCTDNWHHLAGDVHEWHKELVKRACLTDVELKSYAKGKNCFAWKISDLKIYDKPKPLSDFVVIKTIRNGFEVLVPDRPPQSWCYVEEI